MHNVVYLFYKWTGSVNIMYSSCLKLVINSLAYSVRTYYNRSVLTALKAVNGLNTLCGKIGIYIFVMDKRTIGIYFSAFFYLLIACLDCSIYTESEAG